MLDETKEDVDATDDNVERAEITKGRINTSAMGKLSVNKKIHKLYYRVTILVRNKFLLI